MNDYKKTLNLPNTEFPMKANLVEKEPEVIKWWEEHDVYTQMVSASGSKGSFTLHDGPPYANGHVHLGTALNKILKDIVVKSKNMKGFRANFIPGWDCHGLPIELKVEQSLGEGKRGLPPISIRQQCREYAQKFLDIQRNEFRRLGVLAAWNDPYSTMDPLYEAITAEMLATFVEGGSVVRSKKPIHWCCSCETALAEAEVEYADHTSPSIFVCFPVQDEKLYSIFPQVNLKKTSIIIWTTTPWTLPSNMAIAVNPKYKYSLIEYGQEYFIVASDRVDACIKDFGWGECIILAEIEGSVLDGIEAQHPFYARTSMVVLGDHVTLDSGTGCVHTAPGHGREDYDVAINYGIEVYSPINSKGEYHNDVEFFAGVSIQKVNPLVIQKLEETHNLIQKRTVVHSYPHCWRCKGPVIFRATEQWFISMDKNDLRQKALEAIQKDVKWIPSWGENRIYSMVESRPDWCISRQRIWGVPIVALLCERCGAVWNDPSWMKGIARRFADHPTGCDYWYEAEDKDIIPDNLSCTVCGSTEWKRETDILDVWFDSGSSFAAVVEQRKEGTFPADLYLEGSDQHRGWFHSSLLTALGKNGVAPYKAVLTHGYVVDGEGRKMSKSVGNVVAPEEIIRNFGVEILRLWVSSIDYREDIRVSDEILHRLVDAYRRIRNTCRYLLGNLGDFSLEMLVPYAELDPLDQYTLSLTSQAYTRVKEAYDGYEFHKVFHILHGTFSVELSSLYLDIVKDRLYASGKTSHMRRSAQTALYHILQFLVHSMSPILSFTAEEVYKYIPSSLKKDSVKTVFAIQEPKDRFFVEQTFQHNWDTLFAVRAEVTKAIEPLRKNREIGHSLDTHVVLYADVELYTVLQNTYEDLCSIFIVSGVEIYPLEQAPQGLSQCSIEGLGIRIEKARGAKCERCWIYSEKLGLDASYPTLCPRCTNVVQDIGVEG